MEEETPTSTATEAEAGQEMEEEEYLYWDDERLAHALSFLGPDDLKNCRLVSRSWCDTISFYKDIFFAPVYFRQDWRLQEFINCQNMSTKKYDTPFRAYRFHIGSLNRKSIQNFLNLYEWSVRKCEIIEDDETVHEFGNGIELNMNLVEKMFDLLKLPRLNSLTFNLSAEGESEEEENDLPVGENMRPVSVEMSEKPENRVFNSWYTLRKLKFKNRRFDSRDIFFPLLIIDKFPNIQDLTLTIYFTMFYNDGFEMKLLPRLKKIPNIDLRIFLNESEVTPTLCGQMFVKLGESGLVLRKLEITLFTVTEFQAEKENAVLNELKNLLTLQSSTLKSFRFKTYGALRTNLNLPSMPKLKKLKINTNAEPHLNFDGTLFYNPLQDGVFPELEKLWLHSKSSKLFLNMTQQIPTLHELFFDARFIGHNFEGVEAIQNVNWADLFPNLKILRIRGPVYSNVVKSYIADQMLPNLTHLYLDSFEPSWDFFCGDDENAPREMSESEIVSTFEKKERGENIMWHEKEILDSKKVSWRLKNLVKLKIEPVRDEKFLNMLVYLSAIGWLKRARLGVKYKYNIQRAHHPNFLPFLKTYHHSFNIEFYNPVVIRFDNELRFIQRLYHAQREQEFLLRMQE